MVPYDAGDHFEQIFLLYVDAGGRSLLIGDCLENCWLATSNSCIILYCFKKMCSVIFVHLLFLTDHAIMYYHQVLAETLGDNHFYVCN